MPGGALPIPGGELVVPLINQLMTQFSLVVATKDWHPPDHMSFAINHPGKKVGDVIDVKGIAQILWPVHCQRSTPGSELIDSLSTDQIDSIFYKGTDKWIDSYSAFYDNAKQKSTGLGEYLKTRGIVNIYIAGVATDYCVLCSTLDALDLGFSVTVIEDACRGIDLRPGDIQDALRIMKERGALVITSKELRLSA